MRKTRKGAHSKAILVRCTRDANIYAIHENKKRKRKIEKSIQIRTFFFFPDEEALKNKEELKILKKYRNMRASTKGQCQFLEEQEHRRDGNILSEIYERTTT